MKNVFQSQYGNVVLAKRSRKCGRFCAPRSNRARRLVDRQVFFEPGDHPVAHFFNGLMLIALGVLLALPLPLTNVPFGLLLLAYAMALIERDGRLMLVAWALGLVEIGVIAGFSEQIAAWAAHLFR